MSIVKKIGCLGLFSGFIIFVGAVVYLPANGGQIPPGQTQEEFVKQQNAMVVASTPFTIMSASLGIICAYALCLGLTHYRDEMRMFSQGVRPLAALPAIPKPKKSILKSARIYPEPVAIH
jgi:hypothetical protein